MVDAADVDMALLRALEPVFRDLESCGVPVPEVREADWPPPDDPLTAYARLWAQDGGGTGISLSLVESEPEQIAAAAEQVQEWAIEELWARGLTNWPRCLDHPDTHPRVPAIADGVAVWACPADGVHVSPIGSLSA